MIFFTIVANKDPSFNFSLMWYGSDPDRHPYKYLGKGQKHTYSDLDKINHILESHPTENYHITIGDPIIRPSKDIVTHFCSPSTEALEHLTYDVIAGHMGVFLEMRLSSEDAMKMALLGCKLIPVTKYDIASFVSMGLTSKIKEMGFCVNETAVNQATHMQQYENMKKKVIRK